jgi:hypothetical protein
MSNPQRAFLFEPGPGSRAPLAPPAPASPRELGHRAAAAAAAHADQVRAGWLAAACALVERFAERERDGAPFLLEEARAWAEEQGLEAPPDKRAWGAVPMALRRRGRLSSCGWAPAKSSHGSPKVKWQAASRGGAQ